MQPTIEIKPLSLPARIADVIMVPIMRLLSGVWSEEPQQTHRWNNHHVDCEIMNRFEKEKMVYIKGDKETVVRSRFWDPRFHLPVFGGWRKYVVLEPVESIETWHIGWISDRCGVSRIPLHSRVRMLIGRSDTFFVGFNTHGEQITLVCVGEGKIGDGGQYSDIPLL